MARADTSSGKNARLALILGGLVCSMVGLAFASVPLYQLFCQVTGFGGTTQVSEAMPETTLDRVMKVRFNADIHRDLPWHFQPVQKEVVVKVGEPGLAFYEARNLSNRPITGTATFNVTPLKAGQYFSKVQCFCFEEQRLEPGETVNMGVSFYVDPAIAEDPNLDEVAAITLSYTFFSLPEEEDDEPADGAAGEQDQAAHREAMQEPRS